MKRFCDLLDGLEVKEIIGDCDVEVSSLAYDSRKVKDGGVFIAIKGTITDGHKFIKSAIQLGAKAVVCEKNLVKEKERNGVVIVVVENTRKALANISKNWYGNPSENMSLIGVTGTNGKTTVSFLLRDILSGFGKNVGLIGTTGIFINDMKLPATHTTPESLELFEYLTEMKDRGIDTVVMEVSSHSLVQQRVSCLDFNYAVFTNLSHDHLDYHKTIEDYAKAKKILFDGLGESSSVFYNGDDQWGNYVVSECKAKKYSIGRNNGNDIKIYNERMSFDGNNFLLRINERLSIELKTPLLGRFNVENVAFAVSVAVCLGYDLERISDIVSKVNGASGRMQKIRLANGSVGIVDYAHTPDALEKVLQTCRGLIESDNSGGRLICVFGCGGNRDKAKRPKMGRIASELADLVVITDDNPRDEDPLSIINDIYSGVKRSNRKKVELISNRADAINFAVKNSKSNDIILVAGKGHESYQIYGSERRHFDDYEQLQLYV